MLTNNTVLSSLFTNISFGLTSITASGCLTNIAKSKLVVSQVRASELPASTLALDDPSTIQHQLFEVPGSSKDLWISSYFLLCCVCSISSHSSTDPPSLCNRPDGGQYSGGSVAVPKRRQTHRCERCPKI